MDNLAHSLVGLTIAKAGLERLSPGATTLCILAANAPDVDVVSGLFGGRWSLLHYHRGITHSIVGTFTLGLLIPSIFWLGDRLLAKARNRNPRIRYRGLLLASLIAAATHPLMDWTNNYGVRLLMPWSAKWFYGDLVFIVDPYIWLIAGAAAFLLTSDRIAKLVAWTVLGVAVTTLVFLASREGAEFGQAGFLRIFWAVAIVSIAAARLLGIGNKLGPRLAAGSLVLILVYWSALGWAHSRALAQTNLMASGLGSQQNERLIQTAAMPTVANPLRWQCIVETDRAFYRFSVNLPANQIGPFKPSQQNAAAVERFAKTAIANEAIGTASRDERAQIFLGFARFPTARVDDANCIGQTLVQFADLRYTEPGTRARGTFSLEVPVACPQK
jgi:inner membrane protein